MGTARRVALALATGWFLLVLVFSLGNVGEFFPPMNGVWDPDTADADLRGKVYVVTGANIGIGYATTVELLRRGATVVMASRDQDKNAKAAIAASTQATLNMFHNEPGRAIPMRLDLASSKSVFEFAQSFKALGIALDGLILNAGVMGLPLSQTKDGLEMQVGVNCVGHFYLTELLLPSLIASAPSRVVVVGSNAHHYTMLSAPLGLRLDEFVYERVAAKGNYMPVIGSYAYSKACNAMHGFQLARRLKARGISNVYVNVVHPGIVNTALMRHTVDANLGRNATKIDSAVVDMLAASARGGAVAQLYAAVSPDVEAKDWHGEYISSFGYRWPIATYVWYVLSEAQQDELYDELVRLTSAWKW